MITGAVQFRGNSELGVPLINSFFSPAVPFLQQVFLIVKDPLRAAEAGFLVAAALHKRYPGPVIRLTGDLSEFDRFSGPVR
jgi:hypothetical protein